MTPQLVVLRMRRRFVDKKLASFAKKLGYFPPSNFDLPAYFCTIELVCLPLVSSVFHHAAVPGKFYICIIFLKS